MINDMIIFRFEVLGVVKAKGRPRFRNTGKYVQTYTDEKTANYENLVKLSFINAGGEKLVEKGRPLGVKIDLFKSVPRSFSKKASKQALQGVFRWVSKPDCDNVAKSILDALNGVAFDDDSQIVELVVRKHYGEEDKAVICFYYSDVDLYYEELPFDRD